MKSKNNSLRSLLALVCCLLANFVFAQTPASFAEQNRLIRIRKIATEWQGSVLTLHTSNSENIQGRLKEVSGGFFHLETGSETLLVPIGDVMRVSFEPGTSEILLSMASAFMGGAFLSGALLISNEDASSNDVSLAAFIGLLGGGLWGYSTFYETEVIELE